jgi:CBS-domain-containing membrane protein
MRAADVMTTGVITVSPETTVLDVAHLLLDRRISAVPVVGDDGALLGIVSEGDLIHRHENMTERKGRWWHALIESSSDAARAYTRAHGRHAHDVMTEKVQTVTEDTPLSEIADLLEAHRIKRVPVVRDRRVVGVVSRANLLQALVARPEMPPTETVAVPDDAGIRDAIITEIKDNALVDLEINVVVSNGLVSLWGTVNSDDQRRAVIVAAQNVSGVTGVDDHLGVPANRGLTRL